MNKDNEPPKIFIHDLTGIGAFFEHHKTYVNLTKENSGKVVGEVLGTAEVYQLMGQFQSNPTVRLLDFLADQRRLKGRMLDLRDGGMRSARKINL